MQTVEEILAQRIGQDYENPASLPDPVVAMWSVSVDTLTAHWAHEIREAEEAAFRQIENERFLSF